MTESSIRTLYIPSRPGDPCTTVAISSATGRTERPSPHRGATLIILSISVSRLPMPSCPSAGAFGAPHQPKRRLAGKIVRPPPGSSSGGGGAEVVDDVELGLGVEVAAREAPGVVAAGVFACAALVGPPHAAIPATPKAPPITLRRDGTGEVMLDIRSRARGQPEDETRQFPIRMAGRDESHMVDTPVHTASRPGLAESVGRRAVGQDLLTADDTLLFGSGRAWQKGFSCR